MHLISRILKQITLQPCNSSLIVNASLYITLSSMLGGARSRCNPLGNFQGGSGGNQKPVTSWLVVKYAVTRSVVEYVVVIINTFALQPVEGQAYQPTADLISGVRGGTSTSQFRGELWSPRRVLPAFVGVYRNCHYKSSY